MNTEPHFYIHQDDAPAKQEILKAAIKLFGERGLAATSIRDIAAESGYTNPALYKHFASKEDLALHLFETCHRRTWEHCNAALNSADDFEEKLERYIGSWLELIDQYREVIAFLSDSARFLWPKSSPTVRKKTMIGLARTLLSEAPRSKAGSLPADPDVAAASLQGTLSELARMLQVGVVAGPAANWKCEMVALFRKLIL